MDFLNADSDESHDAELDWQIEQGIPLFEDPFIQKYFSGRAALIEQEKKQRHGELPPHLSPVWKLA